MENKDYIKCYCCITNYCKWSNSNQLPFIISQLQAYQLVLSSGLHKTKIKVLASLQLSFETLGIILLFSLSGHWQNSGSESFMAEISIIFWGLYASQKLHLFPVSHSKFSEFAALSQSLSTFIKTESFPTLPFFYLQTKNFFLLHVIELEPLYDLEQFHT